MSTILLIEDHLEILENTTEILELAGYTVMTAKNGKEGVSQAIKHPPDLIISDIMMPALDGYGVLHLIRKNEALEDTPFIFLTAKTERIDFRKGMEMGADDYITKPFNDTELLNAVESRLQKTQRLKDHLVDRAKPDATTYQNYSPDLRNLYQDRPKNHYKKKQLIFVEGNHPQHLYYLIKGKVKAYKKSLNGKELTVGLYASGDFMGYTALLEEGGVYRVTAKTLDDCELALIPPQDFHQLMRSDIGIVQQFIKMLIHNNNQKADWMVQLAYNSLRKRVANALLLLKNKFIAPEEPPVIRITREELANLSGTTTESLIRTISDFKAENLVRIQGGHIELLDREALEHMLN